MPSWRKTKGGGWEVRWYAGKTRRSKTFHGSLREVRAQAHIWEAEDAGRPRTGPITMGDALTSWQMRGGNRDSPLSDAAVASRLRNWTLPRFGSVPIEKVTHLTLEAFYRDCGEHLSPGSIENLHWDIRGALRLAVRDGHLRDNPAEKVRFDRAEERAEIVPPSPEALTDFLAYVDAKPTRAWAELALAVRISIATGARLGEICGLRWGDIDHARLILAIVRNAIPLPDAKVGVRSTKTRVRRRVAIPPALATRLAAHEERWLGPGEGGSDYPVIPGRYGGPINPLALGGRFQKARRETGATFRFHDLRHFAVSVWLTEMPMQDVTRAIGHTQMATTAGTYSHRLDADVDRRTADLIARHIDL